MLPVDAWPEQPFPGFFAFKRIGLVLAGGGAKGVYQAGAMKAVHEFLEKHRALDRVVSISGTSIGAWNAMFWLAGLLEPGTGENGKSAHETWWTTTKFRNLVRPATRIVPGLASYFMENSPWRREFDRLFAEEGSPGQPRLVQVLREDSRVHFYLTRTNIVEGRLAIETNNPAVVDQLSRRTHDLDRARLATSLDRVKQAVFTSMCLPPLFPYSEVSTPNDTTWCEDGGVIDNLPIRLGTVFDDCDLLFVLPLNASFFESRRPRHLFTRMKRVMDVRQGILERQALKTAYQYNIILALKHRRNPIPVFVIAPGQPLKIDTTELWKISGDGEAAFTQMYHATHQALDAFFDYEKLRDFFMAHQELRNGQVDSLPEGGYVEMKIVDPHWTRTLQFEREARF
jgi:predicted acylesterase/phospholipase RssA